MNKAAVALSSSQIVYLFLFFLYCPLSFLEMTTQDTK